MQNTSPFPRAETLAGCPSRWPYLLLWPFDTSPRPPGPFSSGRSPSVTANIRAPKRAAFPSPQVSSCPLVSAHCHLKTPERPPPAVQFWRHVGKPAQDPLLLWEAHVLTASVSGGHSSESGPGHAAPSH